MRQSLIAHTSQSACGSGYRIALRLAIGKAPNAPAAPARRWGQYTICSKLHANRLGSFVPPLAAMSGRGWKLLLEESPGIIKKELDAQINSLKAAVDAQVLYLPTYRRIERELASIFENMGSEEASRNIAEQTKTRATAGSYVELVEFGMKDIDEAIARTSGEIKEFARESLNNLTLKYLGDVVDRDYETARITRLSDETSRNTPRTVVPRQRGQEVGSTRSHHKPRQRIPGRGTSCGRAAMKSSAALASLPNPFRQNKPLRKEHPNPLCSGRRQRRRYSLAHPWLDWRAAPSPPDARREGPPETGRR